jgi:hypothetical protein
VEPATLSTRPSASDRAARKPPVIRHYGDDMPEIKVGPRRGATRHRPRLITCESDVERSRRLSRTPGSADLERTRRWQESELDGIELERRLQAAGRRRGILAYGSWSQWRWPTFSPTI